MEVGVSLSRWVAEGRSGWQMAYRQRLSGLVEHLCNRTMAPSVRWPHFQLYSQPGLQAENAGHGSTHPQVRMARP